MTGRDEATAFAADCERYWLEAGVARPAAAEMRQELEAHLHAAIADGRTIADVVGTDRGAFAEAWAAEQRTGARIPSWNEVFTKRRRPPGIRDAAILSLVAAVAIGLDGEPDVVVRKPHEPADEPIDVRLLPGGEDDQRGNAFRRGLRGQRQLGQIFR